MSAAVLRALGRRRVAAARAELVAAEADQAQLDAVAEAMDRATVGDPDELVNCTKAGAPRTPWNRAASDGDLKAFRIGREWLARRSDVAVWLASLASATSPASSVKSENEEPADPFERARARARDRRAA